MRIQKRRLLIVASAIGLIGVVVYLGKPLYNHLCSSAFSNAVFLGNDIPKATRLLDLPWDVNTATDYGSMLSGYKLPLAEACRALDYDIVKRLLDKGANPNKYKAGNWHCVAALLTAKWDYPTIKSIMLLLFERGADISLVAGRISPLGVLAEELRFADDNKEAECDDLLAFLIANNANPAGSEILYYCAEGNRLSTIKYLVEEAGYDINDSALGASPLVGAVMGSAYDTAKYLVDNGIDVNKELSIGGGTSLTALDYAKGKGDARMVELLAEVGAK